MNKDALMSLLNNILQNINHKQSTVHDGILFDGGKSTQADKPSPHSSYTLEQAWVRARKAFPEEEIRVWDVANTNSMEPLFDDNCQVITEQCTSGRLALQPFSKGDIVVYQNGENLIIHRLQRSLTVGDRPVWQIGGDNNIFPDGFIPESMIKYRLVGILYARQRRKDD